MSSWILAARPKTLTAAFVPVIVGTALALRLEQTWQVEVLWLTLLAAFFIQIATNLFNDVIDFKKGADTEHRLGPQRVTQSGRLSARSVFWCAVIFLILAVVCGVPLVLRGGWVITSIGLISLALAYAYTGGPLPLAYKGLGDLFVILFFGIVAVGGVYYLHTLKFDVAAVIAGLQVGFLATVLLVINNLRDVEEDRRANKLTLPVRFGERFAKIEVVFLIIASFILGGYWAWKGLWLSALLPLVILPFARRLLVDVMATAPSATYNRFLAQAALIHFIFGLQLALGFILA